MYAVIVKFQTRPEAAADFYKRMVQQAQDSCRLETGCLTFDVWTSQETPTTVFLYEIYADRAAFDAHLASPHFKAFDEACRTMITDKTVNLFDRSLSVGIGSSANA